MIIIVVVVVLGRLEKSAAKGNNLVCQTHVNSPVGSSEEREHCVMQLVLGSFPSDLQSRVTAGTKTAARAENSCARLN